MLDRELGVFEPVPPYPPRTEREAEFYTLGDGEMFINMGPQHPSTHGVLRVVLKLDGEKVVDLDPVLGYLHRGVEKLCENADYHQAICYTDPLEYVSSLFCEWSPVMAFEKLLDVQVPRRAEYIRVLSSELNRIASHALFSGWMALDLGGLTPILWTFIERDEIVEMLAGADRPANALQLLPDRRRQRRPEPRVHEPPRRLDEPRDRADRRRQRRCSTRTRSSSAGCAAWEIDSKTALRMVITGPNLRATGVPFDVRRAHPYTVYPELDFDIPTRTEGDCLARYLLRMDEIKQSLRIIDQCLHQMPDGPVMAKLPRLLRPRPGRAYAAIEGPRGQLLDLCHQRRHGPAIPDADPRPVVHPPPVRRRHDARPPHRRHHGHHGLPRPDHGGVDKSTGHRAPVTWSPSPDVLRREVHLHARPEPDALTDLGLRPGDRRPSGEPHLRHPRSANLPSSGSSLAATAILLMTIPTAFLIIYMEMKIIALMNLRVGPDRVGPFGSLLSVVHGLKVLMKEDFTPTGADRLVFTWAPVVIYLASVMTLLVIPFAPGLIGRDLNIGLLYFFAIGGLGVVGLLMAGWASFNKYSLLGGLRSAAQVISYEIPLTLSVVGLMLLAGTMSLNQIVHNQSGWFTDWYVFQQPLGALIFFIAATAEANRTPFDLTEADSEIVAGFATEYSGMRFGFFFFAEYVNVFIISALTVTLFFGGWNAPFPFPAISLSLDPASMGIGLLLLIAIVPVIGTLIFAAPFWIAAARCPAGRRWSWASSSSTSSPSSRSWAGPSSASSGSPACSGSWPRPTASCSPSSGCGVRCRGSGSTSSWASPGSGCCRRPCSTCS